MADTLFREYDIEVMNESDVSGEIVRPFCHAMGYRPGHPAGNLRSEVHLEYDCAFLGRKKGTDPKLRGRPDFVCEVVSYGRWVIEAKAPDIELTLEQSQQAYTYAAHPGIAAEFYILANGREFRLYRIGNPDKPVEIWKTEETPAKLMALQNVLGPPAVKKRAAVVVDLADPLAPGMPSTVSIMGGEISFESNVSNLPSYPDLNGVRNAVIGRKISRTSEGVIEAEIDWRSSFAQMDGINSLMGLNPATVRCSTAYISVDKNAPSLFQGIVHAHVPKGMKIPQSPFSPGGVSLVDVEADTFVEAVGFIDGHRFVGTVSLDLAVRTVSGIITLRSEGRFEFLLGQPI